MKKGITISKKTALFVIITISFALIALMIACVPTAEYIVSDQAPPPFARFSAPERKSPSSVKLTIAVVYPTLAEKWSSQYRDYVTRFANSIGTSLQEIILAKGMTVTGPYENIDMMTYPDKQAANLILTPTVSVAYSTPREVSRKRSVFIKKGDRIELGDIVKYEMDAEGWLNLELREPLSGEKMWIRKLYVDSFKVTYDYGYNTTRNFVIFDNKDAAVKSTINDVYTKILQQSWNYFNTDEMVMLNKKADEIRKAKRY